VKAHVIRVNDASSGEFRTVNLALDGALLPGIGADHPVDAIIQVGQLNSGLWVNRPANAEANMSKPLFKIVGDGTGAERVNVKFGRASAQTIEILEGLKVGDTVILSDMSDWGRYDRIQLK
jgi:HlyD family secretion protein